MKKLVRVFLVAFGVFVLAYGIYFVLGRPPILLPTIHYSVRQGNPLYEIVKVTELDQMTISWATGEVEALADGVSIAKVKYNARSLGNLVDLSTRYLLPENPNVIDKFCFRVIPRMIGGFFYHVVRLHVTLIIQAK